MLRIWDCLFNEGSKILFRVAITLIKLHEDQLLQSEDFGDMAECFKTILKGPFTTDCHLFMAVTRKVIHFGSFIMLLICYSVRRRLNCQVHCLRLKLNACGLVSVQATQPIEKKNVALEKSRF